MPRRFAVKPGGIVKLSLPRNWSPSSRSSFSVKRAEGAGVGVGRAGRQRRVERADLAGALDAVRARVEAEDLGRFLFGERRVPGVEARPRSCRPCSWSASPSGLGRRRTGAAGSRRTGPAAGPEVGGHLPGLRIGPHRADQLGVDAEARGDHEEAVLVARASVRRCRSTPSSGPREGSACRSRRCRSSSCRGIRPAPRSRSSPALRCTRSARRRRRG